MISGTHSILAGTLISLMLSNSVGVHVSKGLFHSYNKHPKLNTKIWLWWFVTYSILQSLQASQPSPPFKNVFPNDTLTNFRDHIRSLGYVLQAWHWVESVATPDGACWHSPLLPINVFLYFAPFHSAIWKNKKKKITENQYNNFQHRYACFKKRCRVRGDLKWESWDQEAFWVWALNIIKSRRNW
jgi:hypothetical protein